MTEEKPLHPHARLFLACMRMALKNGDVTWPSDGVPWANLIAIGREQAFLGLLYDVLCKCPATLRPPKNVWLPLYSTVLRIERGEQFARGREVAGFQHTERQFAFGGVVVGRVAQYAAVDLGGVLVAQLEAQRARERQQVFGRGRFCRFVSGEGGGFVVADERGCVGKLTEITFVQRAEEVVKRQVRVPLRVVVSVM